MLCSSLLCKCEQLNEIMQMKYSAQYLECIKDSLNVSYYYYFKLNKALCIPAQVLEDPSVETSGETMNNDGVSSVSSCRHAQRARKPQILFRLRPPSGNLDWAPLTDFFIFIIISCLFFTGSALQQT